MRFFSCVLAFSACAAAQPVIGSAGYSSPTPLPVAPGQIITLFIENTGPVPTASEVSAVFNQNSDLVMPVLDVRGICGASGTTCAATMVGVTVQIPYGIQTLCPLCANPVLPSGSITVTINSAAGAALAVQPLADQVHFLTQCDVLIGKATSYGNGGLPCPPIVTHADGTMVTAAKPATSGEELVAYATGLGETNPPLTAGKPAPASARQPHLKSVQHKPDGLLNPSRKPGRRPAERWRAPSHDPDRNNLT